MQWSIQQLYPVLFHSPVLVTRARLSDRILCSGSGRGGDLPTMCNNNTAAAAALVGRGSGSTCATIWMSVQQTAAARRPWLVTRTSNGDNIPVLLCRRGACRNCASFYDEMRTNACGNVQHGRQYSVPVGVCSSSLRIGFFNKLVFCFRAPDNGNITAAAAAIAAI